MSRLMKDICDKNVLVYDELVDNFNNCDCVKYSAYRTASKLHLIQRFLWFDHISIDIIAGILIKHRIFPSMNSLHLHVEELKDILYDIYFLSLKDIYNSNNIRIDILINLTIKFLLSAFVSHKKDYFRVLDFKVALVSLCSCTPVQKFKFWFTELADHNLFLSEIRFRRFLESLLSLTKYLSESKSFCDHIIETTLNAFNARFKSYFGISEVDFLDWVNSKPYFLSWLVIYYRFCSTRTVVHSVKCSFCLLNPIIGLRYCCMECISYNLCQACFFAGKYNKKHKTTHTMHEYCSQVSTCATTSAYLKTLVKKACKRKTEITSDLSSESVSQSECLNFDHSVLLPTCQNDLEMSLLPSDLLDDVIARMETETRQLCLKDRRSDELIHRHTVFLQEQVRKLRDIQKNLVPGTVCMSTPISDQQETKPPNLSAILRSATQPASDHSDFSHWLRDTDRDNSLQVDLDNVLCKLNKMLESSFWTKD